MQYKAIAGQVSALFDSQTPAEIWARRKARILGLTVRIERGCHIAVSGKTGWLTDLEFEPIYIFEDEAKVAPV
jgi:hypothetical protein